MEEVTVLGVMVFSAVMLIIMFITSIRKYGEQCERVGEVRAEHEIWKLKRRVAELNTEIAELLKEVQK